MGAYSLVTRRLGAAFAEEMMLAGRIYTAEEMKDVGLVHVLAEPGQGIAEAREYIQRSKRRHLGSRSVYQVGREVNPISLAELDRIVQVWADACARSSSSGVGWDVRGRRIPTNQIHAGSP
jgi:DSF synthase